MNFFEYIDDHSGSVIALATVALAGVTAVYVFLTHRLVRMQHVGPKREIVEKVYRLIGDELEGILWGDEPHLLSWTSLKEKEPFLAFHHLIPTHIRSDLDELAAKWDEFTGHYLELSMRIGFAASEALNVKHDEEFEHPIVEVRFMSNRTGTWQGVSLNCFLLSDKAAPEILRCLEIDIAEGLRLWIQDQEDGCRIIEDRKIDTDAVPQIVEQAMQALTANAASRGLLEEYQARLREIEDLHRRISHQIETSSEV